MRSFLTRDKFENDCWRYYKLLEKSFMEILVYVELDEKNYSTFSYEFVRQLQGIGAEVDSVMKIICGFRSNERKNTKDYCPIILEKCADITTREIMSRDIRIIPFKDWKESDPTNSLFWYKAYNEIKHGRTGDFAKANLKNTLYSLSALYLLEMYYFREIAKPNEPDAPRDGSEIFEISNWKTRWMSFKGVGGFITERRTI